METEDKIGNQDKENKREKIESLCMKSGKKLKRHKHCLKLTIDTYMHILYYFGQYKNTALA